MMAWKSVEKQKEWRAKNPEKEKRYRQKYAKANPQKQAEYQRKWRETHPDYSREWFKKHPNYWKERYKYRKIWEEYFKTKIPVDENGETFCIHHKDGNRKNNSPDNLLCLSRSEHTKLHNGLKE